MGKTAKTHKNTQGIGHYISHGLAGWGSIFKGNEDFPVIKMHEAFKVLMVHGTALIICCVIIQIVNIIIGRIGVMVIGYGFMLGILGIIVLNFKAIEEDTRPL